VILSHDNFLTPPTTQTDVQNYISFLTPHMLPRVFFLRPLEDTFQRLIRMIDHVHVGAGDLGGEFFVETSFV
jgi:hypothetical protein